jgi:glutamate racemase
VLKVMLGRVVGSGVTLVDSAATTAAAMEVLLAGMEDREQAPSHKGQVSGQQVEGFCGSALARDSTQLSRFHFLATDGLERFARVGAIFMGTPIATDELELVDL